MMPAMTEHVVAQMRSDAFVAKELRKVREEKRAKTGGGGFAPNGKGGGKAGGGQVDPAQHP